MHCAVVAHRSCCLEDRCIGYYCAGDAELAVPETVEGEEGATAGNEAGGSGRWMGRRGAPSPAKSKPKFVVNKAFALVMFVVVYMVLFGATVFVLRTLWRHGLCGGRIRPSQDSEASTKVRRCTCEINISGPTQFPIPLHDSSRIRHSR